MESNRHSAIINESGKWMKHDWKFQHIIKIDSWSIKKEEKDKKKGLLYLGNHGEEKNWARCSRPKLYFLLCGDFNAEQQVIRPVWILSPGENNHIPVFITNNIQFWFSEAHSHRSKITIFFSEGVLIWFRKSFKFKIPQPFRMINCNDQHLFLPYKDFRVVY